MKKRSLKIILNTTTIVLLAILTSCNKKSNDKLDLQFEKEFSDSIAKNKASYYEYLYDGLVPQKSYFFNGELKYLKFSHGPEIGFTEGRVYFNLNTDSIEKFIYRKVLPDFKNSNSEKLYDTIFVFHPRLKISEIYFDNKIVDTKYQESVFEENEKFIYEMKEQTEHHLKSR